MPRAARLAVSQGLSVLAGLDPRQYWLVLQVTANNLGSGGSLNARDTAQLARASGLSHSQIVTMLAAATLLTILILNRSDATVGAVVSAATEAGLLKQDQAEGLSKFLDTLTSGRQHLRPLVDRSNLSRTTLPSVRSAEAVEDVRVKIEGENVTLAVAVSIIRIVSDLGEDYWFQANESELEQLVSDLQEALDRLKLAARWAENRLEGPK